MGFPRVLLVVVVERYRSLEPGVGMAWARLGVDSGFGILDLSYLILFLFFLIFVFGFGLRLGWTVVWRMPSL